MQSAYWSAPVCRMVIHGLLMNEFRSTRNPIFGQVPSHTRLSLRFHFSVSQILYIQSNTLRSFIAFFKTTIGTITRAWFALVPHHERATRYTNHSSSPRSSNSLERLKERLSFKRRRTRCVRRGFDNAQHGITSVRNHYVGLVNSTDLYARISKPRLVFYFSGSRATRVGKELKAKLEDAVREGAGQRDAFQV